MKHRILVALSILFFASCRKVNLSGINEPCSGSCVTVSGRFTTSDNQPIANVPIAIRSERPQSRYVVDVRRIAETKTDANGYYYLQFGLKDYEYGPQASATVSFKYSYDETKYLPIHQLYKDFRLSSSSPYMENDQTIVQNFLLPKIAKVHLQLFGFIPPLDYENNYFNVTAFSEAGADAHELPVSGLQAEAAVNAKEIFVGGNDSTKFAIEKRKNGVITKTDTTVYTPVANITNITFNF